MRLEYQRELADRWAVAVGVERLHDKPAWLYAVLAKYSIYKGWRVLAGPGFEREHGHNDFIFRVGTGYVFEVSERISFTPSLEFDFIGEREGALVYGFIFGIAF